MPVPVCIPPGAVPRHGRRCPCEAVPRPPPRACQDSSTSWPSVNPRRWRGWPLSPAACRGSRLPWVAPRRGHPRRPPPAGWEDLTGVPWARGALKVYLILLVLWKKGSGFGACTSIDPKLRRRIRGWSSGPQKKKRSAKRSISHPLMPTSAFVSIRGIRSARFSNLKSRARDRTSG